jgi:hypothetical protein
MALYPGGALARVLSPNDPLFQPERAQDPKNAEINVNSNCTIRTDNRCQDDSGRGVGRNNGNATMTVSNWWVPESRYCPQRVHTQRRYPGDSLRLVPGLPDGEKVKCGDGGTITSVVPEIRHAPWTWRCDGRRGYDWAPMTRYLSTREPVHAHKRATPRSSVEDSTPRRSCKKCGQVCWGEI